jgi:hypothetical protein
MIYSIQTSYLLWLLDSVFLIFLEKEEEEHE